MPHPSDCNVLPVARTQLLDAREELRLTAKPFPNATELHPDETEGLRDATDELPSATDELPNAADELRGATDELLTATNELLSATNSVPREPWRLRDDHDEVRLATNELPGEPAFPAARNYYGLIGKGAFRMTSPTVL